MSVLSLQQAPQSSLKERIDRLAQVSSASRDANAAIDFDNLAGELVELLDAPGFATEPVSTRATVLYHINALYAASWHPSGLRVRPAAERVFAKLLAEPELNLDAICVGYDLLFFLYWCWNMSIEDHVGFGDNVVLPFAQALGSTKARNPLPIGRPTGSPLTIGLLAAFATRDKGNSHAPDSLVRALVRLRPRYRTIVYAWLSHDDASLTELAHLGAIVRPISQNLMPSARIAALEHAIRADAPEVLITDINMAVPTVLFARRVAPTQILYQLSIPRWPIANLDGVIQNLHADPRRIGFPAEKCFPVHSGWNLAEYAPRVDPAHITAERARLPSGRLIGAYCRFAKITPQFLACIAEVIAEVPDVIVALGGTGDAGPTRAALQTLGVADRFFLVEEWVDGHVWGHLLDIYTDTFPFQGAAACREIIAKGKPVVSHFSADMPNMSEERVGELVAHTPEEYTRILRRLLTDPEFYRRACERTRAFASARPTESDYASALSDAIETMRWRQRWPRASFCLRTARNGLRWW